MKKSVIIIYTFISLLVIQSCSSTENIRFEDMTEYELTRYNVLQSTPDQVVCFGPSRGFINGRFQRTEREFFTIRELEIYSILTRPSPHDRATAGGFETDNSDF